MTDIIQEVEDFYRIIPLTPFRRTPGVSFDNIPMQELPRISAIDRVIHTGGAVSPGPVSGVERPWYMHPHQDDNLIVLQGTRHVDIYSREHKRMESFVVTPDKVEHEGEVVYDGPAMLVWPRRVFHRIRTIEPGSASLNFAVHYEGFDIKTNFNIYDLDTSTGSFTVLRKGHQDQITSE
jgi:hypothetical protein